MKIALITLLLLLVEKTYSQTPASNLNEKEKEYFQTIVGLLKFLKDSATKTIILHNGTDYSIQETFYDTVVDRFFNKEKMLSSFAKNSSTFSLEGKVDIIRHLLHACDIHLDKVELHSILVESATKDTSGKDNDILNGYSFHDDQKKILLRGKFDPDTNKLVGFIWMLP